MIYILGIITGLIIAAFLIFIEVVLILKKRSILGTAERLTEGKKQSGGIIEPPEELELDFVKTNKLEETYD